MPSEIDLVKTPQNFFVRIDRWLWAYGGIQLRSVLSHSTVLILSGCAGTLSNAKRP